MKLLLRTSDPPVWNPKPFWCNVTAAMLRSVKEEAEVCRVILRKYSRLEVCNVCQKDPVPTCHHHIFSFYVSIQSGQTADDSSFTRQKHCYYYTDCTLMYFILRIWHWHKSCEYHAPCIQGTCFSRAKKVKGVVCSLSLHVEAKCKTVYYLTIRPVAQKGYGAIAPESKQNGLLIRDPWGWRV